MWSLGRKPCSPIDAGFYCHVCVSEELRKHLFNKATAQARTAEVHCHTAPGSMRAADRRVWSVKDLSEFRAEGEEPDHLLPAAPLALCDRCAMLKKAQVIQASLNGSTAVLVALCGLALLG